MKQIIHLLSVGLLTSVSCVARSAAQPLDWQKLEAPLLTRHIQLTSRGQFVKAGEQYFSPDGTWIIFQAVAVPAAGKEPEPFYSMYVAKLRRNADGHVTGVEEPLLVSPPGSANTCGWFHPTEPGRVLYGSTLVRPKENQKSGFQVKDRTYVWQFPEEMELVTRTVGEVLIEYARPDDGGSRLGTASNPTVVFTRPNYDAECSYSADGRFILYAHVRDEKTRNRPDADIWVYDTRTTQRHVLVGADGYDGGPFFSPDGRMICYRSDRSLDDLLQLYVAQLLFDEDGIPVGVRKERQLTANGQVNWAPYWHPSGKLLVFGSSGVDHRNYEVFAVEVDLDKSASDTPTRRITHALGADILPVFSNDGKLMMWCSQRGPKIEGEGRPSSQVWLAECVRGGFESAETLFAPEGAGGGEVSAPSVPR